MEDPVSTSSSAAVAPSDGVCHFDRLPTELLAVVYDLAYGYRTEKDLTTKTKYEQDHEDLIESGKLANLPSFEHQVDRFLVSKCFFLGAIEAFAKAQYINLAGPGYTHDIVNNGAIRPFVRSIKAYGFLAGMVRGFPSLRHLEIVVTNGDFEYTGGSFAAKHRPWVHVYQDAEFAKLNFVDELSMLRGLQTFKCLPSHCEPARTQIKRQVWEGNISALQTYLTPIVTAPKSRPTSNSASNNTESMPLYPGSRVTGIGCQSSLITVNTSPPLAFKPKQAAFDTNMVTRVMCLETDQLSRWVYRVLRQHPELASLLDDPGFAPSR